MAFEETVALAQIAKRQLDECKATIARLTAERDEARASAAAAYERASAIASGMAATFEKCTDRKFEVRICQSIERDIRTLATEAETTALAEMLDAETRACAEVADQWMTAEQRRFGQGGAKSAILARLDQRKEAGE